MLALRWNGKRVLLSLLTAALLSGCATAGTPSYRVVVPILQSKPVEFTCATTRGGASCLIIRTSDYQNIVRELKAACLANKQTPQECQANPVQR